MVRDNKDFILNLYNRLILVLSFFTFLVFLYDFGFHNTAEQETLIQYCYEGLAFIFFIHYIIKFLFSSSSKDYFQENTFEFTSNLLLLFILIVQVSLRLDLGNLKSEFPEGITNACNLFIQVYALFYAIIVMAKLREKWLFVSGNPSKVFVFSFMMVILLGSLIFMMPECTRNGIRYVDSLFMCTSAVCVTGLTTVNLPDVFTIKGQIIFIILIQIGGLGMVTLTTFIALFLRKGFKLKDQVIVQDVFSDENLNLLTYILKLIIIFTLAVEFLGALVFFISWENLGLSFPDRLFKAVFHAVSSYCNAGLSNFHDGFQGANLTTHTATLVNSMMLIIIGGIGFYTVSDIVKIRRKENLFIREKGLRLQTKIILRTTFLLIFGGAFLIWLLQFNAWHQLPVKNQILWSLFSSVTSRTAGFSCIEIGNLFIPTCIVIIFLMYVGAAPNSTGGGIKITTFITLLVSFFSFIRGKDRVELGWNTIPMTIVRRAFIVFIASVTLLFVSNFLLTISEKASFFDLFFESVSAFGTVGLSRGITPSLTDFGKVVILLVMFLGRIGMFTIALAVVEENENLTYRYPETSIMVG